MHRFTRTAMGALFLSAALTSAPAPAADPVPSDFGNKDETWKIWCEAQIDQKNGPVTFHKHNEADGEDGEKFVRIAAIEESLGGNKYNGTKCTQYESALLGSESEKAADDLKIDEAEDADDLGPPVFGISPEAELLRNKRGVLSLAESAMVCPGTIWDPHSPSDNAYCTRTKIQFAKSRLGHGGEKMHATKPVCMQRQEVRYHPKNVVAHHFYKQNRSYRVRFRLPEEAEICDRVNGLRWVNVQWKLEPLVTGKGSPFLAQRFDNGYLFVTVQAENCRCIVAAAAELKAEYPQVEGRPLFCQWTGKPPSDPSCTTEAVNLQVNYHQKKWLENTLGRWTEMTYAVRPGMKAGRIEIRQDGDLVSTVTGTIGYQPESEMSRVKFKFGQYRDYQPRAHEIEFDQIDLGAVEY